MKTQTLNFINKRTQMLNSIMLGSRALTIRFISSSSQNNPFFAPIPQEYNLLDEEVFYLQITFRKYDIRILADFRKDIEWNKGDPVGDGGASIFRKSTHGYV